MIKILFEQAPTATSAILGEMCCCCCSLFIRRNITEIKSSVKLFCLVSIFSLKFSVGKITNRKINLEKSEKSRKSDFKSDYIFPRLNSNPILFDSDLFFPVLVFLLLTLNIFHTFFK